MAPKKGGPLFIQNDKKKKFKKKAKLSHIDGIVWQSSINFNQNVKYKN